MTVTGRFGDIIQGFIQYSLELIWNLCHYGIHLYLLEKDVMTELSNLRKSLQPRNLGQFDFYKTQPNINLLKSVKIYNYFGLIFQVKSSKIKFLETKFHANIHQKLTDRFRAIPLISIKNVKLESIFMSLLQIRGFNIVCTGEIVQSESTESA